MLRTRLKSPPLISRHGLNPQRRDTGLLLLALAFAAVAAIVATLPSPSAVLF